MKKKRTVCLIDIGNTTTHIGILKGQKIVKDYRLKRDVIFLKEKCELAVFCSVVPSLTENWIKYFKKKKILFFEFKPEKYPFKVKYSLSQLGSDRLCNALGVYSEYSFPCIIVDSGTTTTVELIDKNGNYLGGAIFPGINTSKKIIVDSAEKIKNIKMKEVKNFLGRNTAQSLYSGIFASTTGGIEFLIKKYKKLVRNPLVIGTGGNINLIKKQKDLFHIIDPLLCLKGLRKFYEFLSISTL